MQIDLKKYLRTIALRNCFFSNRRMRKYLPYKNVRTLIQICYVWVTNLYQLSNNLETKTQCFGSSVKKLLFTYTKDFYIEN